MSEEYSSDESSSPNFSKEDLYWQAKAGTALAQVFNVKIKHNDDDVEKFELCGCVWVEHGMGTLDLYDKEPDNSEYVNQGDILSLLPITQFDHVIYATHGFSVHMDLTDKDGNEFIQGSFRVPPSDISFFLPDKCRVQEVQGIMGVATIYYAPLKVARPFCISADFKLSRASDQPVEIYGCIKAWYGKRFCYGLDEDAKEHCRMVLYDKKREEAVKVHQDQAGIWINLLEDSHVASPLYSPLVIQAKLQCVGADGHEEPFEDQFEMPPNYIQTMNRKINRKPGRVEVCVDSGPFIKPNRGGFRGGAQGASAPQLILKNLVTYIKKLH